MPPEFLELMNLYRQPVKRQSTVAYLPQPRHAKGLGSRED
jgi:hypothetical protein